jgi:hypothetical protein
MSTKKLPTPKNAVPVVGEQGAMILSIVILSQDLTEGCFADFFCKPRKSSKSANTWRISLLSKVKTSTREESSTAFATTVAAIVSLKDFVPGDSTWDYLGPNCSKVSNKAAGAEGQLPPQSFVLRAYDTRMRPTSRSPNLFLRESPESPPSGAEGTVAMFHFKENKESNEEANFGIDIEPDSKHDVISTFFDRTGHLQVLCVPYLPGHHKGTKGVQGRRLANALNKLHSAGLVHGDIRGYNTINGVDDSYLIDFDFGGKANTVKYPPEYNYKLPDGERVQKCCHTVLISPADDVYALRQWLLFFNELACLLTDPNLPIDYLKVQDAIKRLRLLNSDPRLTKAEDVLDKMIAFFETYKDDAFEVIPGRTLTELDA